MYRSVCVISLFVLSAHAAGADPTAMISDVGKQLMAAKDQCFRKHGINPASLVNFSPATLARPAKCGLACGMTAIGAMNGKGVIDGGILLKMIPADFPYLAEVKTVIEDCADKDEKDTCEGAFNFVKCVGHEQILRSLYLEMAAKAVELYMLFTN